jgi:metal-dependent amidase/aminoacylase/carboxypeptidase family protein
MVVGGLANGSGAAVLLRCELDALPLREETGAPYASTATATDASGHEVPVDLSAHLAYGAGTGTTFWLLTKIF